MLPVVIEASGAGGTTKLTLVVKAPSVAQELAVEREMLERAKHEKEAREGKEREEKAARQGAERTAREAAERASEKLPNTRPGKKGKQPNGGNAKNTNTAPDSW